jgi:hypothetical protein
MPAGEYADWQEYFSIYPFTQDREDARAAMLAAVIANVSGKTLKKPLSESTFLIDYLGERQTAKPRAAPSIEQQQAEFAAFIKKYKAAEATVKGK